MSNKEITEAITYAKRLAIVWGIAGILFLVLTLLFWLDILWV